MLAYGTISARVLPKGRRTMPISRPVQKLLVNVTGPIAVGATSLCKGLAATMGWAAVFERDMEIINPFFAQYNEEPGRYAFRNQVAFLASSVELHREIRAAEFRSNVILQDFCPFEHIGVYAGAQRDLGYYEDQEYEVLTRLGRIIEAEFIKPSLIVYLSSDVETLLRRIHLRGRPSEVRLQPAFVEAIIRRFETWIATWDTSSVIRWEVRQDRGESELVKLGSDILGALELLN